MCNFSQNYRVHQHGSGREISSGRISFVQSLVGLIGVIVLTTSIVSSALAAGSVERGQAKSITCAACHGADGKSINPEWPNLAGQHEKYIVDSLLAYKNELRKDVLMSGQVATLDDQAMEDLAAYFAAQVPVKSAADPAVASEGERLYRGGNIDKGISACIACHGPTGRGIADAGFPSLAGQHARYTEKQLLAYRSKTRQSDTEPNQVMRNISVLLTEDEIKAVATYIEGLQ